MKTKIYRNIDLQPFTQHERALAINYFIYRICRPMGTHLDPDQSGKAIKAFADRYNLGLHDAERVIKGAEFTDGRFVFDTNFGLYHITILG